MDLDALRDSPIGQLVPIKGHDARHGDYDYFAYLPEPLPSEVDLAQHTWNLVADANAALAQLRQACAQLPNPHLLIAPALTREAVDTSALEGTYGTVSDVLEARLPLAVPRSPEVREIRAYERMARQGFEWVSDRPITMGMLCDLQRILAEGSQEPPAAPGHIRDQQVIIGPEHSTIYEARFIPPPPDDRLLAGLNAWETWIRGDHDLPIPVRAALAHYQFETLHPFSDGNGRVGRLAITLQMVSDGALAEPALTLSPWLLKRRSEYQDQLLRLSKTGDWNDWVCFFCEALIDQCGLLVKAADELRYWCADLQKKILDRGWSGLICRIADGLIDWPVLSVRFATEEYGVSQPAAQGAINRLVEIGALAELTGKSYGRLWGATEVMELVERL